MVLVKRYNKKTKKKQYCLVSDENPKKVLKWFDKKPTKKEVLKEERRVNYFKHLKSSDEPELVVQAQSWKEKAREMYEKKIQRKIDKEVKDKDYKFVKIKTPEVAPKLQDPFTPKDIGIIDWKGVSKFDIEHYNKIISDRIKAIEPVEKKLTTTLSSLINYYKMLDEVDVYSHELDEYLRLKKERGEVLDQINELKNKRMFELARPVANDEDLVKRTDTVNNFTKQINDLQNKKDDIDRKTYKIYITTLAHQLAEDPELLQLKNIIENIDKLEKEYEETYQELEKLINKIITMPIPQRKQDTKVKIEHIGKEWVEKDLFEKEANELLNKIKNLGEVIEQKYDFSRKYEELMKKKKELENLAAKFKEIGNTDKYTEMINEANFIEKQALEIEKMEKGFVKDILNKYEELINKAESFDVLYTEENVKKLEELKQLYSELDKEVNKQSRVKDLLKSIRESEESAKRFEEVIEKKKQEQKQEMEEKDVLKDTEIIYHLKQYGLTPKDVGLDLNQLTNKQRTLAYINELVDKKRKDLEEVKQIINEKKDIPMYKYIADVVPEIGNLIHKEIDNITKKHSVAISSDLLSVIETVKESQDAEKLIKLYYYLLKEYEGYRIEDINSLLMKILKDYNIDLRDRLMAKILDLSYEFSRELLGDKIQSEEELEHEARIQAYKVIDPKNKDEVEKFIKNYVEKKQKENEEKMVKALEDLKNKISGLNDKELVVLMHQIKEKGLSKRVENIRDWDLSKGKEDVSRDITREYTKLQTDYYKHLSDEDLENELRRVIRLSEGIAEEGEERFIGKITQEHVQALLDEYNRRQVEKEKKEALTQAISSASHEIDNIPINDFSNLYMRVIKRLDSLIERYKKDALNEMLKEQEKLPPFAKKRRAVTNKDVLMYLLKNKLITPKDYAVYERGLRDYDTLKKYIS